MKVVAKSSVVLAAIFPLLPMSLFYSRCCDLWFHGADAYNMGLLLLIVTILLSLLCPFLLITLALVQRNKFAILCCVLSIVVAGTVATLFCVDPDRLIGGFMAD
jgi:hypothetical protein